MWGYFFTLFAVQTVFPKITSLFFRWISVLLSHQDSSSAVFVLPCLFLTLRLQQTTTSRSFFSNITIKSFGQTDPSQDFPYFVPSSPLFSSLPFFFLLLRLPPSLSSLLRSPRSVQVYVSNADYHAASPSDLINCRRSFSLFLSLFSFLPLSFPSLSVDLFCRIRLPLYARLCMHVPLPLYRSLVTPPPSSSCFLPKFLRSIHFSRSVSHSLRQ